jgi:hypothetical protein
MLATSSLYGPAVRAWPRLVLGQQQLISVDLGHDRQQVDGGICTGHPKNIGPAEIGGKVRREGLAGRVDGLS